uniref:Uncharacterized protein n=1 Tax=Aegilops tauschii subsp. strangulata TaxID=200361 RepID=A0A453E477_AEGTS
MSLLFDHITSGMPLAGPRSHPTPTPKKKHANFPSAASRRSPSALLLGAALSGESAWPVGSPHLPPCSSLSRRSLPVSSSSRRPTPAEGPPFPLPTSQAVAMSSSGKVTIFSASLQNFQICYVVLLVVWFCFGLDVVEVPSSMSSSIIFDLDVLCPDFAKYLQ